MIEEITKDYDWFECMQLGLGHDSWWYTNRTPEECVNVKIHAWVDLDQVKALLSPDELKAMDTLGIDIEELTGGVVWSDWGLIPLARKVLEEELKDSFNVSSLEYGGRSGGWLAVVYEWDDIPSDYDDCKFYSYKEIKEFYQTVTKALEEHSKVTDLVNQRKSGLEKDIEAPESYIEEITQHISKTIEVETSKAHEILKLSEETQ